MNKLKNQGGGVLKHGAKIDVYAMGVTMLEMAAVHKPNEQNAWELNFEELLESMIHRDPEKRLTLQQIKLKLHPRDHRDEFDVPDLSEESHQVIDNACKTHDRTTPSSESTPPTASPTTTIDITTSPTTTPIDTMSRPINTIATSTLPINTISISTMTSPTITMTKSTMTYPTTAMVTPPTHVTPPTPPTPRPIVTPPTPPMSRPVVTRSVVTPPTPTPSGSSIELITKAAKQILFEKKSYKDVCISMNLNMDERGGYLRSSGSDYKKIQSATRTLRRRELKQIRREEINELQMLREKVKDLTKRVVAAELREQQAMKKLEDMKKLIEHQTDEEDEASEDEPSNKRIRL